MQLSKSQKRSLIEHGFLHIPGVIPRVMVDEALRAINNDLGKGMDPALMGKFQVQTFCPALTSSPAIVGLFTRTPAQELAESALGAGRLRPVTQAQIALRFPGLVEPSKRPGPHIDGIPDRGLTNGVPAGTILSFTALAHVLLSELPGPDAGNFTVWPGSHRAHAEWLRRRGWRRLLEGMPEVAYADPLAITGRPGDLILAHYLLGHSVSPNVSPHVRYGCFFRLEVDGLADHRQESITAPWRDWQGLQDLIAADKAIRRPTRRRRAKPRR